MLNPMAWNFLWNTLAALGLGALIGVERQFRHHVAGLKTNALVAIGSAIYVGLSLLMDHDSSPTRIAAQIVSGLGFLGGGVIMREGFNVRGLNTAATIWCSGAVGSLAGGGFVGEAAIGTAAILLVNVLLLPLTGWVDSLQRQPRNASVCIAIESALVHSSGVREALLRHVLGNDALVLTAVEMRALGHDRLATEAHVSTVEATDDVFEQIIASMSLEQNVTAASWRRAAE